MDTATDRWERLKPEFDAGEGERASIGLLALATDRVGTLDTQAFLAAPGVALFSTRVQSSPVATPESLKALGDHLEQGTRLLVPGSRLDAIGFSCTSGTLAVGIEAVRSAIWRARPGIAVVTPIEAGGKGLKRLGARRISLLVPYLPRTADLVAGVWLGNDDSSPTKKITGGGMPVEAGGSLMGGIGVSGAPGGDADHSCAAAGIDAVTEELELQ